MNSELNISAVILAHKDSVLLSEVISSVKWCNEVIVVASDKPKEIETICVSLGAKFYFRAFDNFSKQKSYAFSLTRNDWIINIDSDEVVTDSCAKEIFHLSASGALDTFSCFAIPQKLVFLGKTMRFGGTSVCPVRLFDKKRAQVNANLVHELIESDGKVGSLQKGLLHYSYSSLDEYFEKLNYYSSLSARQMFQKGKRTNSFRIWGRFPLLFFRRYVLQLGFLDGTAGFTWSFLSAFHSVVKQLKLQELYLNSEK